MESWPWPSGGVLSAPSVVNRHFLLHVGRSCNDPMWSITAVPVSYGLGRSTVCSEVARTKSGSRETHSAKELKSLAITTLEHVSVVHPTGRGSAQPTNRHSGVGLHLLRRRMRGLINHHGRTWHPLRVLPSLGNVPLLRHPQSHGRGFAAKV